MKQLAKTLAEQMGLKEVPTIPTSEQTDTGIRYQCDVPRHRRSWNDTLILRVEASAEAQAAERSILLRVRALFGRQPDPAYGKVQNIEWQDTLRTADAKHSDVDASAWFEEQLLTCGAACVAKRRDIEKDKT